MGLVPGRWLPELLAWLRVSHLRCPLRPCPLQLRDCSNSGPHSLCFSSQSAEFPKKATSLEGWWGGGGSREAVFIPQREDSQNDRGQPSTLLWPLSSSARELLPEAAAQHLGHIDFI